VPSTVEAVAQIDDSGRQWETLRGPHLNRMKRAGDYCSERLPHLCSVLLLEPINRSLPAADHRLAVGRETGDSPCPRMLPAVCSSIANATATAMAATLSLVGSSPSITLGISMAPFLPGNSRVSTIMANIKIVSAVMTTATPTTAIVAASSNWSLKTSFLVYVSYGARIAFEETAVTVCKHISQIDWPLNAC